MIDYASIAADALAAIKDAGTTASLVRFLKTHDPVAGEIANVTATYGSVDLVVLPVSKSDIPENQSERLIQALARGSLRKFLIAADGAPFNPKPTDVFIYDFDDSLYWTIVGVTTLAPAGTALIHTAFVEETSLSDAELAAIA